MISFKLFVEAIHHAIVSASDSLMDKNEGLLDKYFEKPVDGEGKNKGAPENRAKKTGLRFRRPYDPARRPD